MDKVTTVAEFRAACVRAPRPLGVVATMGALHRGHLELVRRSRLENATTAVTVFVNPRQFGPREDFAAYPRDLSRDLALLEDAGVDLVFAPSVEEMYPVGFDTTVDVGRIASRLEGARRPGHFGGVATVVCKLLAIARPDRAYFGQKDAQQCLVVGRLVRDLDLGAEVVVVPTVRDDAGLALSSRNAYLTPEARRAASVLHRSLCAASRLHAQGERDAEAIRRSVRAVVEGEPLARLDYVSVADSASLEELDRVNGPALVSLAVRMGRVTLIDNLVLQPPGVGTSNPGAPGA